MKKIFLFIFCLTHIIHAMEDIPGMYPPSDLVALVREKLAKDGNVYNPEPASEDAPLTPELVLNPYWRALQNKSSQEKDEALKKILMIGFSDAGYYLKRYHIAAAALIGANLNVRSYAGSPLYVAALFQDVPLCALLLQQPGIDPNWREYNDRDTPLLCVKKVFLAQLFLNAGAKLNVRGAIGMTYLHVTMQRDYEPQLIKWCIAHGMDPLAIYGVNTTPLHSLIDNAYQHTTTNLKAKIDYLLESLDFEPMQELIKSVKILIERNNRQTNVQWLNSYLETKLNKQKIS